ncbi:hypothetical protein Tco_0627262 [Tanacetum coccineum]|uniref:Retroviral polymerase SH3-like domain-containing protein n=1 Tax=Tanacetum coccineum TaxID=301880 RepID=A0ABQ4WM12_9ASTR
MYDPLSLEIWSITFSIGLQIQHAEDLIAFALCPWTTLTTAFVPAVVTLFTLAVLTFSLKSLFLVSLDAAVLTYLAVLFDTAALGELYLAILTKRNFVRTLLEDCVGTTISLGCDEYSRADGGSKNYKIFSEMLDDFDRQDIMDLHRLVEERYATSRPEGYDLMLWGDLKILFQPDEEDEVERHQHEYNLISWRLFDSCGIHILLMDNGIAIHMMIEKKYPLTQEMLSNMLSRKLEVDHENEMAFELLRDHLGKFDEKADDGFFLGYSLVAKAFRIFNIKRQEMKETVHVTFSEDDKAISQSST